MAKPPTKGPLAKAFSKCAIRDLKATTMQEALVEIVDVMVAKKVVKPGEREEVLEAFLKRETLGTTAIGKGVALPHVRRPGLSEVVGCIAHSTEGMDCRALDGQPTHTICAMLTPVNPPNIHLDFMQKMVRLAADDFFTKLLNQTRKLQDFVELFAEKEAEGI